jgi:hypothetical protein
VIALIISLYLFAFYLATGWEIVYEVIELLKPNKELDKGAKGKDEKPVARKVSEKLKGHHLEKA